MIRIITVYKVTNETVFNFCTTDSITICSKTSWMIAHALVFAEEYLDSNMLYINSVRGSEALVMLNCVIGLGTIFGSIIKIAGSPKFSDAFFF